MSEFIPTDEYIHELETELAVAKKRKGMEEEQKRLAEETKAAVLECNQARAATSIAKRDLAQYQKQIADARAEIEHIGEQKSNMIDETTERAREALAIVKRDLEKLRINVAAERKTKLGELADLTATLEQQKKQIAMHQANLRDLAGGAATIESNAMAQSESINRNKLALEREVGNLQAHKLQLSQDIKLLEVNREEAKRYEAEKKQAADSAHRAKQELQAISDQLEAKRLEMSDLSKMIQTEREEALSAAEAKAVLARENQNLQKSNASLEREQKTLEQKLNAARHQAVKDKQDERQIL